MREVVQNVRMGLVGSRAGLWIRQVALAPFFRASQPLLFVLASRWRRLLFRTTFIAITGSVGKTTAKTLLADILASRARTYRSIGTQNSGFVVALNILRVRPWHRFAVLEIGIDRPGAMRRLAAAVKPDVAVILAVARTHSLAFEGLDGYAAEKSILLDWLRPGGLAVLNGDDPRVAAMADESRFRVNMFGTSPAFELWADHIASRWPDRLSFRAHRGELNCEVRTQLLGSDWIPSLTAALAVATHCGVPLERTAEVVRASAPYTARLEPVTLPSGAVVIRDDYGASTASLEASLRFLREARAGRRILVMSDYSDSGLNRRNRLKALGAELASWLDLLILISKDHAYDTRKTVESGLPSDHIFGFTRLSEASAFLKTELRSGDLVLLKGRATHHLARIFFAQIGTVRCWQEYCPKTMLCDGCWELGFQPEGSYTPPSVGLRV